MTTTAANTAPSTEKPNDTRALLKDLQTRFDVFRNFSPLAIGIDKQVFALLPELSKKSLRLAMRSHTISTRYLKEMEKGTVRLNLTAPADEVTDENRQHAAEQLRERFKKQAEARKAAEAEAKAEQRRMEKLNQLTEKFGRK